MWSPEQYEKFKAQRSQPFYDLLAMVSPRPGMRALDLGCGTGALTAHLHQELKCESTLGIDSSPTMLERARALEPAPGLSFEQADVTSFEAERPFDLVFSNAVLQWIPNHRQLWTRVTDLVAPGGQIAIQIPSNHDHPSHVIAHALAREEPYVTEMGGYVRDVPVLRPETYASMLYALGFTSPRVRLEVYPHVLPSASDVIEWVKGTLLTDYQKRMPESMFSRYLETYTERVLAALPQTTPHFYPFKRILMSGAREG